MLVLSMSSKRQRRPNVRLGEIGDVSAAFACGFSQKSNGNLGPKRWKLDFVNPSINEDNPNFRFYKQKSPEFAVIDPGVSPRISVDMQQNRENKNPNSAKMASEILSLDNIVMSKSELNFGTITRKARGMKRRSRSTRGKNSVFGGAWNSELSPQFSSEDGKEYAEKEVVGFTSNTCDDSYPGNGFKDLSDNETPATSKEACEYDVDDTTYNVWQQGNSNDSWKEDACSEGNNAYLKSGVGWDETRYGGNHVNTVSRWLEKLGFGKYASVFEMHEVDEETLPLLTLEDLKEMGVFAVGPRRKLYTAIQQLRGEGVQAA
ncbi:hypothetical protein ACOSQ2_026305 [Xanthoceras sorbifolium]|uniref:SAM domain-containing protein n=1 Tax=Xanthoceras sorbifolium TaxID=99658 RepID=A0ABQ8H5P4_9ROSI|nr:hypothetical protein JRO89_XS13G0004600 [Xanthoceras sorbifolium]